MSNKKKSGVKKGVDSKARFATRILVSKEIETAKTIKYAEQYAMDAACIALNLKEGWGAERLRRFCTDYLEIYEEIRSLERADTPDLEYAKAKVEQALQRACGKYYVPREQRYGINITYNGETFHTNVEEDR